MNLSPPGPHLLDTSAVIAMMRERVAATPEALVPFATVAELLTGVERNTDRERERARVESTIGAAPVIYPTARTLANYGRANAQLQRSGRPIPVNDVWNAALALEHDLPLLADDAHFGRVPGLRFIPVR